MSQQTLHIPPAIGTVVAEKMSQVEQLQKEAASLQTLAQNMLTEYALAAGAIEDPQQPFNYNPALRTITVGSTSPAAAASND